MIIGEYIYDKTTFEIHKEDDKYFFKDIETNKIKPTNFPSLANIVGSYWNFDCISTEVENKDNNFIAKKFIPIYDWIFCQLFGYGNTKEEALKNVENLFETFLKLNEKIEENIKRNYKNQMKKSHRFGLLPKNRTISTLDNDYYNDLELIFFDDGDEELRNLAIKAGIPEDGRSSEICMGYTYDNNIVFTKHWFIQGEFDKYKNAIDKVIPDIIKYYNLENYKIYYCAKTYLDTMIDENGNYINENIDSADFDYFVPYKGTRYKS